MYQGVETLTTSNFFDDLLQQFINIQNLEGFQKLNKIDSKFFWYYADEIDKIVYSNNQNNKKLIEIDIKSAFASICKNWFPDSELVKNLESIKDDKLKRNILISTSLKNTGYLEKLNWICKMIILGIVASLDKNAFIYELKKDGIVCQLSAESLDKAFHLEELNNSFINFIIKSGFNFSIKLLNRYLRAYKTTYLFYNDQNLEIKGLYKHLPEYLNNLLYSIFMNDIPRRDLEYLFTIYSLDYLYILKQLNLSDLIFKYYKCNNKKYITTIGYSDKISNIVPQNYIKFIIIPSLLCNII